MAFSGRREGGGELEPAQRQHAARTVFAGETAGDVAAIDGEAGDRSGGQRRGRLRGP